MCGGCDSCGYSSIGSAMYTSNSESSRGSGANYVPSTSLGYQAQPSNYSSMSSSYSMGDSYQ